MLHYQEHVTYLYHMITWQRWRPPPPHPKSCQNMTRTWETLAKRILMSSWGQCASFQCNGQEKSMRNHSKNSPLVSKRTEPLHMNNCKINKGTVSVVKKSTSPCCDDCCWKLFQSQEGQYQQFGCWMPRQRIHEIVIKFSNTQLRLYGNYELSNLLIV